MELSKREVRELLNMHLKSALGAVMDADANVLAERIGRCMDMIRELVLRDLEK